MKNIKIKEELRDFIVPLQKKEFLQLESNLLAEGCREALIVWETEQQDLILIDGHNRYKICCKHNIPFEIDIRKFEKVEEVKIWMLQNQLGRRNLTPDQLSYYRGLKYLGLKKKKGGYGNVKLKGQVDAPTSEVLSKEFKVSKSTIERDSKYAEALNVIANSNPKLKNKVLSGEVKVKKSDLKNLLKDNDIKDMIILNESDLHHKINMVKNQLLTDVETELKEIEKEKSESSVLSSQQDIVEKKEPLFLNQEDRLKIIKGRIVSAINRAINNKDIDAIEVLKALIDKLEFELISDYQ